MTPRWLMYQVGVILLTLAIVLYGVALEMSRPFEKQR